MHQFNEHHPELKGFSAFYDAEILPNLERDETARLEGLRKVYKARLAIGAAALCMMGVAWYFKADLKFYLIIALFGAGGAGAASQILMKTVKSATKETIVGHVCRFLGWAFQSNMSVSPRLGQFIELGLVNQNYSHSKFEDQISGTAHGANFLLHEAHLEKREGAGKNRKWVTKFRGQLLLIKFHQKFLGRTIVLRDKGWLQRKKRGGMKRVGLVDPVFEKIFEAYGTDQVEARYLLTPTFMQRLVDLETSVDGNKIRFGFDGGQLLIAVETANRYEAGSMFNPLIETARTQKILDEIGAIYDVIDGVMKR